MKIRPMVAWVLLAAEDDVGIHRAKSTYESFAPGVKARMSVVPIVPPPSLDVFAVVSTEKPRLLCWVKFGCGLGLVDMAQALSLLAAKVHPGGGRNGLRVDTTPIFTTRRPSDVAAFHTTFCRVP